MVTSRNWPSSQLMIPTLFILSTIGPLSSISRADSSLEDLNADGVADSVAVAFQTDANGSISRYTLTINDATDKGQGEYLYGTYEVVDIDTEDGRREIAIAEAGPSGDYKTHYLWYDGRDVHNMGSVPGRIQVVDGSGIVSGTRRGSVLHTWYHPAKYGISDRHTIEFVEQELYTMNTAVTLREDLALFEEREDAEPGEMARRGEQATILATDDERWCLLEIFGGKVGWFQCCGSLVGGWEPDRVFEDWPDGLVEGQSLRLKVDLPLFAMADLSNTFGTAKAGEVGTIHHAFNDSWLELKLPDGTTGFIRYCDGRSVGGLWSHEVFDGMSSAD